MSPPTPRFDAEEPLSLAEQLEEQLPRLARFVALRLGAKLRARESVSDIVQSAAREVLEDLRELEQPSRQELRVWLYRAAERKLIDKARYWNAARRAAERDRALGTFDIDRDARTQRVEARPSAAVNANESADEFAAAFAQLSDEHREIILLARILELPHATIAQLMGRSAGATRMLLVRALTRLTELM